MNLGKDAYKKMRDIRKKKGVTQKYVADKLGFKTSQAYANIEYGNTELKLSVALQVATILGVSVYDFLGEKVKQNV
ncbi:helix-turn-helix domain-containing protein [Enterococcus gallinarum]|uniref:helix-turn-helix domain-containing protein n=1 Tax=Enterococcus gallinarum TaxID=1353 RepID=UPI002DB74470|nr:helix-turn-helix transcriptional regulator [Enterococcus gallinarum]MEB5857672.1 helix-turn-helix domain-containing protein [Enterococcus gallinarum]